MPWMKKMQAISQKVMNFSRIQRVIYEATNGIFFKKNKSIENINMLQ